MANWICRVAFKQYLDGDDDAESVKRAAAAIADAIERAVDRDDPATYMACRGLPAIAKRLRAVGELGDPDALNGVIAALYDYGDSERIWFE